MRARYWLLVLLFILAAPCGAKIVAQESPVSPQQCETPTISTAPSDKADMTRKTAAPRTEVSAPKADKLLKVTLKISWYCYLLTAILIALGVRFVLAALLTFASMSKSMKFIRTSQAVFSNDGIRAFCAVFSGVGLPSSTDDNVPANDYLHPLIVGFIEVSTCTGGRFSAIHDAVSCGPPLKLAVRLISRAGKS
jgi:hypothetical protein